MDIVEPGRYDFDLDIRFPRPMKNPFELPASMARDFETTSYRGATGKVTVKDPVEKDVLAKSLATDAFKDLAGTDLTVTRLELTPRSGPTAEEQVLLDYLDCFRAATRHVDSCVACQNEKYCEVAEPILFHFAQAQDACEQLVENLPA